MKLFILSLIVFSSQSFRIFSQTNLSWYYYPTMISATGANNTEGINQYSNGDIFQLCHNTGEFILQNNDTMKYTFTRILYDSNFNVKTVRPLSYTTTFPLNSTYYFNFIPYADYTYIFFSGLNGTYNFDSLNFSTYTSSQNSTLLAYDSTGDFAGKIDIDSCMAIKKLGTDLDGDPIFYVTKQNGIYYYLNTSKDLSSIKIKTPDYSPWPDSNFPKQIVAFSNNEYLLVGDVSGNPDIDPTSNTYNFQTSFSSLRIYFAIMDSTFSIVSAKKFSFNSINEGINFTDNKLLISGQYYSTEIVPTKSGPVNFPFITGTNPHLFFLRTDTSLVADWALFFSDTLVRTTFIRNQEKFNSISKGIYFGLWANTSGYITNSGIPARNNENHQILFCDTIGLIKNCGEFKNRSTDFHTPVPYFFLNDSTLFLSQQLQRPINLSINNAPVIIHPDSSNWGSVFAKYTLKAESGYITSGKLIADLNNNAIIDSTDRFVSNHVVKELSTGQTSLSLADGTYRLMLDSGAHEISPGPLKYFNASQPLSYLFYLNDINPLDSTNIFYFTPKDSICDLEISSVGQTFYRQGSLYSVWLNIKNTGPIPSTGNLTIHYTGNEFSFSSSSIVPSGLFPDSIIYSNINLPPLSQQSIQIFFDPAPPFMFNDSCTINVNLQSATFCDNNLKNNTDSIKTFLVASFDPNNKLINGPNLLDANNIDTSFTIKYIINFQNTGNDTAFQVILVDSLNPELDITSMNNFHSSHNYQLELINNLLVVTYDSILLPDSSTNLTGSQGYFSFAIKPHFPVYNGTNIINRAGIYFDYNLPVITEPAILNFSNPSGISILNNKDLQQLVIIPNPSDDIINIKCLNNELIRKIQIKDFTGRSILSLEDTTHSARISISQFTSGIYIINAELINNQKMQAKFIKY